MPAGADIFNAVQAAARQLGRCSIHFHRFTSKLRANLRYGQELLEGMGQGAEFLAFYKNASVIFLRSSRVQLFTYALHENRGAGAEFDLELSPQSLAAPNSH